MDKIRQENRKKASRLDGIARVRPEREKKGYEKLDYSEALIKIDKSRRRQWQEIHANVILAYTALIERFEGKRPPTTKEVADFCDLAVGTVKAHLAEISFKPLEHPLRILTDAVIMNIYESTRNNAASQKLWMQLMEGFSETNTMDLKIKEIPPIAFVPFQNKMIERENEMNEDDTKLIENQ